MAKSPKKRQGRWYSEPRRIKSWKLGRRKRIRIIRKNFEIVRRYLRNFT